MSQDRQTAFQVQYWEKPMGINDTNNVPISDAAVEEMRHSAAQTLSYLPAIVHQLDVGSTWERSPEESMTEYRLLDLAAQSIEILKALNLRDRDRLQEEARRKREEQAAEVLKAIKYRVCPIEMQRTKDQMRELRKRGCPTRCVEDCVPTINKGIGGRYQCAYNFVFSLQDMEKIMSKVRTTAIKLQMEAPDGHWAIDLLNYYSDGWFIYLDEFISTFCLCWLLDDFKLKMEAAKQRAKDAEEIVIEVEKEWKELRNGFGDWRGYY